MASLGADGCRLGQLCNFLFEGSRVDVTLDDGEAGPDQGVVLAIGRRTATNTSHVQIGSDLVCVIVQIEGV